MQKRAALRLVQGGGSHEMPPTPIAIPVKLPEVGPKWQVVALARSLWTALQFVAQFIVRLLARVLRFAQRPRFSKDCQITEGLYTPCGLGSIPRRLCGCQCHLDTERPPLYVAPLVVEHFFLRRRDGKLCLTILGQFPWCLRCDGVTTCTIVVNGHPLYGWYQVTGGYRLQLGKDSPFEDAQFVGCLIGYCYDSRSRVHVTVKVDGRSSGAWFSDLDRVHPRLVSGG